MLPPWIITCRVEAVDRGRSVDRVHLRDGSLIDLVRQGVRADAGGVLRLEVAVDGGAAVADECYRCIGTAIDPKTLSCGGLMLRSADVEKSFAVGEDYVVRVAFSRTGEQIGSTAKQIA